MPFTLTLIDLNPGLVRAWRSAFANDPEVEILHGSMLQHHADAWVTPTNARGSMDGGFDAVVKRYFGSGIEKRVKRDIGTRFGGSVPVGCAACVSTAGLYVPPGGPQPKYLISTPTMCGSAEQVGGTLNTALAFGATVQAVRLQNAAEPGSIRSIAMPGLGSRTGRMAPEQCAAQMHAAYELLRDEQFDDFADMRAALLASLGDVEHLRPLALRRSRVSAAARRQGALLTMERSTRKRFLGIF